MQELFDELKNSLNGEVRHDPISRSVYSVDASIYEVAPLGVVLPKSKQDIVKLVKITKKYGVSLIPRGAATGITGGCIGSGIVVDLSKYLNQILSIDYEKEYAICEPGVIQDQLNSALSEKGYRLGPDTSTGNRATLGGMVANNAAGARSLKYGCMIDHVLELEMVLANGELVYFKENEESNLSHQLKEIAERYRDEIKHHFPNIPRRVSGYNLNKLISDSPINLAQLIVGSEGTLGIVTEIKVKISKKPAQTGLCILAFDDMIAGFHQAREILQKEPISFEMIDSKILEAAKTSPSVKSKLDWLKGHPEVVFVVEVESENAEELNQKLRSFGDGHVILTDPEQMAHVWEVRKAGLGLLLSKRSYSRAIAFIEDIAVPPESLADFMVEFLAYMKAQEKEAGIYGHVGPGCLHIRPYIDMRSQSELQLMKKILQDVTEMVKKHGGSLSGEHGDGFVRSWLNKKLFGEKLYQAFVDIKTLFDPDNRMNPGKIVHPAPFLENLRCDQNTPKKEIETFLDFSKEGGFSLSVDLCNGNGLCRKKTETMCPSFQASNDEYDSTRARAQALRSIIHGRLPEEELTGEALHNILDLCIECKGCKKECPSQVDMAKMKSELLYQYQEKHGYTIRERLFANIAQLNLVGSPVASLFNRLGKTKLAKSLMESVGITPHRELPSLASERFSTWYKKNHTPKINAQKVVLFNDTFTEFNCPEVGIAAYHVLSGLGFEVIIPPWKCCGRPLISKGFLPQAKSAAESLINTLYKLASRKIPIIGLEPSCILAIKDDFQGLLGYDEKELSLVIEQCTTFDEFIATEMKHFPTTDRPIIFHGHCHQKALVGTNPTMSILKRISSNATEIPTGCCGMAGSFGYEKEHYDFSIKIAELQLIPALEKAPSNALIIANGFSCRHQIAHTTNFEPLHLAQLLTKI